MSQINFYQFKEVGGITGWFWIDTDTGAWDGPVVDWEQHHSKNIQQYVTNYDTVIQAGGNLGMYPRLLSGLFNRVYTFEPDPLNFTCLVANNKDNDNVIKFQSALGSENGLCNMRRLTMQNVGMHMIEENKAGTIPVTKIDSYGFTNVGLIMLDLEGYEGKALSGAHQTIEKYKPVIFVERASTETKEWLAALGYTPVVKSAMDTVFIYGEINEITNKGS
ncbi:FkbM family methyltransferase [Ochrobactrum phage vB_OspM_OC]|nr:FkbM family methyltransferase [Ochrobactrum phage vB_OspM_OC]